MTTLTCCCCNRHTGNVWRLVDNQRLCEMCASALEEGAARELEIIADGGELLRPLSPQERANLKHALQQMQLEPVHEETPEEHEWLTQLEHAMAEQYEDEATARMADCLETAIRKHLGGYPLKYMLSRIGAACRLVEQRFQERAAA